MNIALEKFPLVVITGPTASGKTKLAARIAARLCGEVISADSRQVYRGMDIGTGKDLEDFVVDGIAVPYHLIDIVEPGYEYNVFEFQRDFLCAFQTIRKKNKTPVLCGGTGMYIEAAIGPYLLQKVEENPALRSRLADKSMDELTLMLQGLRPLHNITDTTDRKRLVRAIEIATYEKEHPAEMEYPIISPAIFVVHYNREQQRKCITERLRTRLEKGMVDEVKNLLDSGLKPEQLDFYGLEYRYLTQYLVGKISYQTMVEHLNTAIHQFAKRQMTWFRRMDRSGYTMHWIDAALDMESKTRLVLESVEQEKE